MSVSGLVAAAAGVAVAAAESWGVVEVAESAAMAAGPWVAERTAVGGPVGGVVGGVVD